MACVVCGGNRVGGGMQETIERYEQCANECANADANRYRHCCAYWGEELKDAFILGSKGLIDAVVDKDISLIEWIMENPE